MRTDQQIYYEGEAVFTLGQASKLLNLGLGRNRMIRYLRQWGILLARNEPSQKMIDMGYMKYGIKIIEINGNKKSVPATYVTTKGLNYFERKVKRELFKIIKHKQNED